MGPPREDPQAYARWLAGKVGIGEETLDAWRALPVPATIDREVTRILGRYRSGLQSYGAAAELLADGYTEEADNLLGRGDRIGRQFQQLASKAGFRECDGALPL